MVQKYRIYINEKVILLASSASKRFKHYERIDPEGFDLKTIFVGLLNSKSSYFFIKCNEPKIYLKKITQSLPLIKAAGGLVKNEDKAYLFIFRNGKWDIPKGKVEKQEKVKQAAVREVEEECGIKVSSLEDRICKTYHAYQYKGEVVLKKTYWFNMNCKGQDKLVPQTVEGITDARWIKKEDISLITGNTFLSIMDVLIKEKLVKETPVLPSE